MRILLKNASQIVTVDTKGSNLKRGKDMNEISPLSGHSIIIENDKIADIIPSSSESAHVFDNEIDLSGKVVLPGLVECHTHTAYAGSRANEFRMKLRGVSYEEIAEMGGGINSTVSAVRNSTKQDLKNLTHKRVKNFIRQGITSLEIKSGYGLNFENEIKLLEVINEVAQESDIDIYATYLGAHTIPPEYKSDRRGYINSITREMIPYIAKEKLATFCDAFCETTAFTPEEVREIFNAASIIGLKLKLHSEQFNNIGGLDLGIEMGVLSIDHLEVIKNDDIPRLASHDIVAVLLPGVSFFLNYGFAPARGIIDANGIVALSTDFNPGSSHISSFNLIMSLAALKMKMSVEEVISAVTINSAKALGINNLTGSIEPGKKADFSVFDTDDYSDIIYSVGSNLNVMTIKNGKIIYQKSGE